MTSCRCGQPVEPRSVYCLQCQLAGASHDDTLGFEIHMAQPLNLGPRITGRLVYLGLSQGAIARRLGVDPSIVQLWCSSRRAVPEYRVHALAAALDTTAAVLLDGVTAWRPPPRPAAELPEPAAEPVRLHMQHIERIEAYTLFPLSGPSPVPGRAHSTKGVA